MKGVHTAGVRGGGISSAFRRTRGRSAAMQSYSKWPTCNPVGREGDNQKKHTERHKGRQREVHWGRPAVYKVM